MAGRKRQPARDDKTEPGDTQQPYTKERVENVAKVLRGIASEFDGYARSMKDEGLADVKVRDKMLKRAIGHINNFGDQIRRVIREARGVDL